MFYQLLSLVGAVLILTAFAAQQMRKMEAETAAYQALNLAGGFCLCVTAVVARQYGFILMEGTWVMMSTLGLIRVLRNR